MNSILDYIAKQTDGKNYKSFRYCYDAVEVPKLEYDDNKEIKVKRKGETDKSLTKSKSLQKLATRISTTSEPLFKYFLDGSRRTYKVDDIAYDKKLYPIIAGQIGVAVCKRCSFNDFQAEILRNPLVICVPNRANAHSSNDDMYFMDLVKNLNKQKMLLKQQISFSKILAYNDAPLKENEKYEDKGVAKIQDEMVNLEKKVVLELVKELKLNSSSFLIKDGSLEYMKSGDLRELSAIKTNYDCVVGVSKAFNPEALSNDVKDISRIIADLKLYHRTPAFMYETPRIPDVKFAVWYLRIRDSISPFDGVLKIEKILVWNDQEEEGLDSDEIDLISANIINERNPVCYGKDDRWAKHLYPIYLTERYIKSKYLSDIHFINLF
ncbi:hypothetical protein KKA09_04455 [Patescibacteria group bacterium]|nr:hypothetical protein [Patescibacteria group bacterium]